MTFLCANRIAPDGTPRSAASHLGLNCLPMSHKKVLILRKHIVSQMGSYFRNRWSLSYPNITKNMKTYIRCLQHKNQHQDIKQ